MLVLSMDSSSPLQPYLLRKDRSWVSGKNPLIAGEIAIENANFSHERATTRLQ